MKIEWTKTGGSAVTLGDDSVRRTINVRQWGGAAQVQVENLFRAANPFAAARGNVSGQFSASVTESHASMDAAAAAFATEYGRLGEQGSLAITVGAKVVTHAGAILQSVARGDKDGVRQEIIYVWVIGTIAVV